MTMPFLKLTINLPNPAQERKILVNPAVIAKVTPHPASAGSILHLMGPGEDGQFIHVTASVDEIAQVLEAREA